MKLRKMRPKAAPLKKTRLRTGDQVIVLTGKEKGNSGKIVAVNYKDSTVTIEGLNMVKRHRKQQSQEQPSAIVEKEAPLHISNVMYLPSGQKKGSKLASVVEGKKKKRKILSTKQVID